MDLIGIIVISILFIIVLLLLPISLYVKVVLEHKQLHVKVYLFCVLKLVDITASLGRDGIIISGTTDKVLRFSEMSMPDTKRLKLLKAVKFSYVDLTRQVALSRTDGILSAYAAQVLMDAVMPLTNVNYCTQYTLFDSSLQGEAVLYTGILSILITKMS